MQLLVGSYTRKEDHVDGKGSGVYALQVDESTGKMELQTVTDVGVNPSFVCAGNGLAFVVNECADEVDGSRTGFVRAYLIKEDGSLELKNTQLTHGSYPCHCCIDPEGEFVAVANYGGGSVALFPIQQDGSIQPASTVVQFEGASLAVPSRQEAPHCHSTTWLDKKTLLALDLGNDKVMQLTLNASGELVEHPEVPFILQPPGAGPRHLSLHPTLPFAYVIHELSNTLSVYERESNGSLAATPIQTVSTRKPELVKTDSFSLNAEVQVSPSGQTLTCSNRGDDTLVTFAIGQDGRVGEPSFVSSGGTFPRHFVHISDKLLLSANQNSDTIVAYYVHENGTLEPTGESIEIPTPVCLCPVA
ncbi:hypothetical protein THRCLA_05929 [Thraustotheca clavata]|uniref:6-phosphogluconolactonase n=1 Tax=Thraustotheca clavata TaxID=74557 RepID=A0A1V9ZR78_9STRA|nr:hypothetical protein THRCLA_05929 [Thraustotheca clavata]